jgi:integration host factor subunit alpha
MKVTYLIIRKENPLMTLTKEEIIDTIYNRFDFSKAKSAHMVESLLKTIKNTLANGEDVLISGFGKFILMKKRERRGRNPQTGDDLMLGERNVVRFRWSEVLREKMNGGG